MGAQQLLYKNSVIHRQPTPFTNNNGTAGEEDNEAGGSKEVTKESIGKSASSVVNETQGDKTSDAEGSNSTTKEASASETPDTHQASVDPGLEPKEQKISVSAKSEPDSAEQKDGQEGDTSTVRVDTGDSGTSSKSQDAVST